MKSTDKEICIFGFHSCGNFQYKLCDTCDDGSNYEYFQDAYTFPDDENYFEDEKIKRD